jgi:peptide deformylase
MSKSIFSKIKEIPPPIPMPVMVHGDKIAQTLHAPCDRISNHGLKRIKYTIDTLKLSAAHAGSYSLSANQIGITSAIFVIHKNLTDNLWLHPNATELLEAA